MTQPQPVQRQPVLPRLTPLSTSKPATQRRTPDGCDTLRQMFTFGAGILVGQASISLMILIQAPAAAPPLPTTATAEVPE